MKDKKVATNSATQEIDHLRRQVQNDLAALSEAKATDNATPKLVCIESGADLEEQKRLTAAIASNLDRINDDGNDLEELERQTNVIVGNLNQIGTSLDELPDLEELERQASDIAENLNRIERLLDCLPELSELERIIENLERIKALLRTVAPLNQSDGGAA